MLTMRGVPAAEAHKNARFHRQTIRGAISEHSLKMSVVGVDVDGELVGEGGRRNVDGGAHL